MIVSALARGMDAIEAAVLVGISQPAILKRNKKMRRRFTITKKVKGDYTMSEKEFLEIVRTLDRVERQALYAFMETVKATNDGSRAYAAANAVLSAAGRTPVR